MTDGRDFEWSAMAEDTVGDLIDDGIYAERFVGAIADEILDYLGRIVKDELAAEYDRGYQTAMDMEVEPAKAVAWERGLAEGVSWGGYLEGGYGHQDAPVNPYSASPVCHEQALCPFAHGSQAYCPCKYETGHDGVHDCEHSV